MKFYNLNVNFFTELSKLSYYTSEESFLSIMNFTESFSAILNQHVTQMAKSPSNIANGKEQLELTNIEDIVLINLAESVKTIFSKEPTLLNVPNPICVIGDIHGHLLDLYRILKLFGLPPTTNYLFLGDLIDRGPFSLETVTLVFCLKVLYPKNVFLIRGNHEFEKTAMFGGFFQELSSTYMNSSIFGSFISAFNEMPLAALCGPILCVHAGICPVLNSLSQIESIKRPIPTSDDSIVCGLTWSDPSPDVNDFSLSRRGAGFYFGSAPLFRFLNRNNLKALVRGHECVSGSVIRFHSRCVTVFSASNYCGVVSNNSGVLQIDTEFNMTPISMPYLKYIQRDNAKIQKCAKGTIQLNDAGRLALSQSSFSLMSSVTGASKQEIAESGLRRRLKIGNTSNNTTNTLNIKLVQSNSTPKQLVSSSLQLIPKKNMSKSHFFPNQSHQQKLIPLPPNQDHTNERMTFLPSIKDLDLN